MERRAVLGPERVKAALLARTGPLYGLDGASLHRAMRAMRALVRAMLLRLTGMNPLMRNPLGFVTE